MLGPKNVGCDKNVRFGKILGKKKFGSKKHLESKTNLRPKFFCEQIKFNESLKPCGKVY